PGAVDRPELEVVIPGLEPGTVQERERNRLLLRHERLDLRYSFQLDAVHVVAQALVGREHAEELEPGAVAQERQLRDLASGVDEAPIAPEAGPHDRRYRIHQAVEVTVSHGEVRVQAVMGQDCPVPGPAQEQPGPHPVVTVKLGVLERIVETLQVRHETAHQPRSQELETTQRLSQARDYQAPRPEHRNLRHDSASVARALRALSNRSLSSCVRTARRSRGRRSGYLAEMSFTSILLLASRSRRNREAM